MVSIGMSTSCSHSYPLEQTFRLSAEVGFDGLEVMVSPNRETQDANRLLELSRAFNQPILSIHAPVLLATRFVFGLSAKRKLERSAELARQVGAPTVVVHPPFRWEGGYSRVFAEIVGEVADRYQVQVAVENMFGWRAQGLSLDAYAPTWNPGTLDIDSLTLDFSHAALNGTSGMDLAREWGSKLQHVHLCDGTYPDDNPHVFDEHLAPGEGSQPIAEVLQTLANSPFTGSVIAEVSTGKEKTWAKKVQKLEHTLEQASWQLSSSVVELSPPSTAPDLMVLERAS